MLRDPSHLKRRVDEAQELLQSRSTEAGDADAGGEGPPQRTSTPPDASEGNRTAVPTSQMTPDTDQYEQDYCPDASAEDVEQARRDLVQRMHEENSRRAAQPQDNSASAAAATGTHPEELPPTQPYAETAELISVMAEVSASQQQHARELSQAETKPPQGADDLPDGSCSPTVPMQPQPIAPPAPSTVPPAAGIPVGPGDSPDRDGSDGSVASALLRSPAVAKLRTEQGPIPARASSALAAFPRRAHHSAPAGADGARS